MTRVTQRAPSCSASRSALCDAQRVRLAGSCARHRRPRAGALWLRIDGPRRPVVPRQLRLRPRAERGTERRGRRPRSATIRPGGATRSSCRYPADVDEIAFGVSVRGAGTAWFDALELTRRARPIRRRPRAPAAVRYVEAALALMREHSLRRAEVDWPAVRDAGARACARRRRPRPTRISPCGLPCASSAIGTATCKAPRVSQALRDDALSRMPARARHSTAPQGRRLRTSLGYLHVPGFAGGTPAQQVEFAESLKNIIQRHDEAGVCGWAVDLRQNTGGNLWPMLAGLGPLLGEGELAASVYPDGRRVAVWYRDGQAGFGDYTQLRVRSPYRVRAATPVARADRARRPRARPRCWPWRCAARRPTRSFGAPTRGLSAGNRTFRVGRRRLAGADGGRNERRGGPRSRRGRSFRTSQ